MPATNSNGRAVSNQQTTNNTPPEYTFCFQKSDVSKISNDWKHDPNAIDAGVDISIDNGTALLAVGAGKVHAANPNPGGFGNYWICLELDKPINGNKYVYYGHCNQSEFSAGGRSSVIGQHVTTGQIIARVGMDHVEIGWARDATGTPKVGRDSGSGTARGENQSGKSMLQWISGLQYMDGTDVGGVGVSGIGGATPGAGYSAGQLAAAASFTGFLKFPSIFNAAESQALTGPRALMNDVPLMPFIQELAGACLRHFMSLPDGRFYAFYPDYFGSLGKHPYWEIPDIEIIDGKIDLSDDALATHVFVVGDTTSAPDGQIDINDKITTGGVITIFDAFTADFLNGPDSGTYPGKPTLSNRDEALKFLQKYGARPNKDQEYPMVRAPIYEAFLAYQKFCFLWSQQFKTQFQFTFMPELYPGGLVSFPEHGLQCYIDSVTHNCNYETGFTTTAELSAPSALKGSDSKPVNQDRQWVHAGMIRAISNEEVANFNPTTMPLKKNKGKWKPGKL